MDVVIVKYNAGNVQSVMFALERLGVQAILSDSPETIKNADKVIFPGVGEASTAMQHLKNNGLDKVIPFLKQPVLGICLGMQLMCSYSEEGETECLGIFKHKVLKFIPQSSTQITHKIPQMGWNNIYNLKSKLFIEVGEGQYMYFVHSYYVGSNDDTIASCNYINEFSAAINKDNFYAVQFHPEKSGKTGQRIIENFIKL